MQPADGTVMTARCDSPLYPMTNKVRENKMDAAELRAMQAPIKERYKSDPAVRGHYPEGQRLDRQ